MKKVITQLELDSKFLELREQKLRMINEISLKQQENYQKMVDLKRQKDEIINQIIEIEHQNNALHCQKEEVNLYIEGEKKKIFEQYEVAKNSCGKSKILTGDPDALREELIMLLNGGVEEVRKHQEEDGSTLLSIRIKNDK